MRGWHTLGSECVPLRSLDGAQLLGKGALERLAKTLSPDISALVFNLPYLKNSQREALASRLGVRVYDRSAAILQAR